MNGETSARTLKTCSMSGYEGEIILQAPANTGAPDSAGQLTARFVRYDGCQQLTLWLPADGWSGYDRLRIWGPGGDVVEDSDVKARLNGRIQILIDTYGWPPGAYHVAVTHEAGWQHDLKLEKLQAGIAPPPVPAPEPEPRTGPIVYRDGFGNILPDTDLELRAAAQKRLAARFGRRLEFEGNFRAGTILYVEGDIRIPFYHEMCGGGVHFTIDIPPAEKWEAATGRPLSEREDIVAFVAAETQRRQASSWRCHIYDNRIDFTD